ncbi:M1 family aminopeptidase [Rheinheimera baltica]|uniref:M1 family aminopeptidase n=1 Tax=Rheinheimera baltica TaxID=67576 RepID=A0ABT9I308_9GAMM|nr:M1 family aminopeptidase [Rheinheimera baltica]MDP5137772.1 M1 family aminopeptidase [Rheinheimera baltica]
MMFYNEWRYLARQPVVWLAFVLLPLVAYVFAEGMGGIDTLADKRLQVLQMTLLMMALPLLCGALAPIVFLRDHTHSMSELILVTPQSPLHRLFYRFIVMCLLCAGLMLLGFFIMWITLSLEYGFQPLLLALTLWGFALMTLPACAFFTALACYIAQRFKSVVVIYAIFCSLWLMYLVLASLTGAPMLAGSSIRSVWLFDAMRLLDPFGNTPLIAMYNNIAPNTAPDLYGDGHFYLNRLFYCLLAIGLFVLSFRLKPQRNSVKLMPGKAEQPANLNRHYQTVTATPKAAWQLGQLTRMALLFMLKQRLNQLILLGWTFIMFNEVLSGINYAEPLSVISATSLDALNRITDDVLPLLGSFLIALWVWQLSWYNRQTAMAELISATPVRSGILIASNIIALSGLILLLMLLSGVGSITAELVANSDIRLEQYPAQLSKVALSLWLLGALFSVFHSICRSPLIAGAWCAGILLMKYTPLSGKLGLTHTLWNIAASPLQPADAFWGLEQSQSVYWPFMTFWILLTIALLWLAGQWSHRSTGLVNHKHRRLSFSSAVFMLLALVTGINLHNNIIDERPLMSSDLRQQWRAEYEQHYAAWAAAAQPVISHIDANVDFFPQAGNAVFVLNYTLENRTTKTIDKLLIGHATATPIEQLELSVAYTSHYDKRLSQYTLTLANPLAPGSTVHLRSRLTFTQPQHWPAVTPQFVKPSFSYIRGFPLLPTVGFQPQYTLRDEPLRQRYGLAPLNLAKPSTLFAKPDANHASYDWVTLHSVVSTDASQTPLAQGELVKQWQQQGRSYAEYHTMAPIRHAAAWYSTGNTVLTEQHKNVTLSVYSPEINAAARLNMLAMQDTLSWMAQHITPYRVSRLNLLATPSVGPSGYALPQMIMIDYQLGFLATPAKDAGFDQRYRRAVHETAHQWFGHDLGNGVLEDRAFLVESLAKYIELVLIEQRYGRQAMQALVDYERQRFQRAMIGSSVKTQALVDATEQHDMYSRATLVFAMLRQQLGDDVLSHALRLLWQQHAYPNTPATSMDFVRTLKSLVDAQQQQLVDALLLGTDIKLLQQVAAVEE